VVYVTASLHWFIINKSSVLRHIFHFRKFDSVRSCIFPWCSTYNVQRTVVYARLKRLFGHMGIWDISESTTSHPESHFVRFGRCLLNDPWKVGLLQFSPVWHVSCESEQTLTRSELRRANRNKDQTLPRSLRTYTGCRSSTEYSTRWQSLFTRFWPHN